MDHIRIHIQVQNPSLLASYHTSTLENQLTYTTSTSVLVPQLQPLGKWHKQ